MPAFLKHHKEVIILLILILFLNVSWIAMDGVPPYWDEAGHTTGAVDFAYFLSQLSHGTVSLETLMNFLRSPYFPLGKMIGGFMMFLTYPSIEMGQYAGTVFYLASILVQYLLIYKLTHSKRASLLGAMLVGFSPDLINRSRDLSLDISVLLFYSISFYYYVTSDWLTKKKQSALFFIFVSLTLLSKIQAAMYFVPMVIYEGYILLKHRLPKTQLFNIGIGIFIGILLVLPIVIYNLPYLQIYFDISHRTNFGSPGDFDDPFTWYYYLLMLPIGFFLPVYLPLLVGGIWYFFKSKIPHTGFYALQILGIYLVMTLLANKGIRFIYPIITPLIVVMSWGLHNLLKNHARLYTSALIYIFIFGLMGILVMSLRVFPQFGFIYIFNQNIVRQYRSYDDTPIHNLVKDMDLVVSPKSQSVLLVPNSPDLNINVVNLFLRLENNFVTSTSSFDAKRLVDHYFNNGPFDVEEELNTYRYIVYSDRPVDTPWIYESEKFPRIEKELMALIKKNEKNGTFKLINVYPLSSGEQLFFVQNLNNR